MKRVLITATVFIVAAAAARTMVNQDFEGAKFPPKDWVKVIYGRTTGDWVRKSAGGNHYAYGWVKLGKPWYDIELQTRSFYARVGRELKLTIRYSGWRTGAASGERIYVCLRGNYTYYSKDLSYSRDWRPYTWVMPPLGRGGYYRACFGAGGDSLTGKKGTINFNVDDVRVTCCPPAVDPTSLGRVKALFR